MNSGKMILTGLVVWLVFLIQAARWGALGKLLLLLVGAVPWIAIAVGLVMLGIGYSDLRSQKAEPKSAPSN